MRLNLIVHIIYLFLNAKDPAKSNYPGMLKILKSGAENVIEITIKIEPESRSKKGANHYYC